MTAKLVNTENHNTKRFEGHLAPLLSVSLDPKGEFVLSSSCDGSVKLWKIESEYCLKSWKDCWDKSNDVCRSSTPGQIAWSPDGSKLAIPTKSLLKIITRNQWDNEKSFKSSSSEDIFTAVAFSKEIVVGGTDKGKLVFWNLTDGTLIKECQSDKQSSVQSIDWHPTKDNEISFIKQDGNFGTVTNFINGQSNVTSAKTAIDEDNMNEDELGTDLNSNTTYNDNFKPFYN